MLNFQHAGTGEVFERLYLPEERYDQIEAQAKSQGKTINEYVIGLLSDEMLTVDYAFPKKLDRKIKRIAAAAFITPQRFVQDHIERFVEQIYEDGIFAEFFVADHWYKTLKEAHKHAIAADEFNKSLTYWYFFRDKDGDFWATNSNYQLRQHFEKGWKAVAIMADKKDRTLFRHPMVHREIAKCFSKEVA